MCAHIGQKRDIYPPSIFRLLFDSYPLPPFAQVDGGGCYREKFFLFFWLRFRILFFQNPNFNSLSFAQYSSSDFSLCIISYWFSLWILIFSFTILDSDYNFGFCIFRFYISTRFYSFNFYSHQFRLVSALSILCFNSSTLYLFNSSACYKQTSMLMQSLFYACFGYFKAFWRVFACFRCSLSSWGKIMRQKA